MAAGALQHLSKDAVYSFDEKTELKACLLQHVRVGDNVLVKASRGMKLEEVVNEWMSVHH